MVSAWKIPVLTLPERKVDALELVDDAMEMLRVSARAIDMGVPEKDFESIRHVIFLALEKLDPVREYIEEGPEP